MNVLVTLDFYRNGDIAIFYQRRHLSPVNSAPRENLHFTDSGRCQACTRRALENFRLRNVEDEELRAYAPKYKTMSSYIAALFWHSCRVAVGT